MSRIDRDPVSSSTSHTTSRNVTFSGAAKVMPRCWHSSTSYFGASSSYRTNSSWARSEKSRIGKTDLKTSCSPTLARCSGATPICRKWSYELFWTSIRFGIGATSGMRPKLLRMRFFPVKDVAMHTPRCGPPKQTRSWWLGDPTRAASTRYATFVPSPAASLRQRRQNPACAITRAPGSVASDAAADSIGARPDVTKVVTDLLYFDSRTRVFKLFFDFCRFFLVDTLLDRLGRRLDEIFGFLEAKAGDRPDLLDYVDLLLADCGQDHIELSLLDRCLGCRSRCASAERRHRDGCRGRDAPFFLQHFGQLRRFDHTQGRQIIDQLCQIRHLLLLRSGIEVLGIS